MTEFTREKLASMIDHTLLKATATREQIKKLCDEAIENNFASVCINPCHVAYAAELLKNSNVKVCTVIGFPLGANTTETKKFETQQAVANGADECDMVINIGALKEGNIELVENDIKGVVEAANGAIVKVIIETCYLTDNEKIEACKAAARAGADFVKTSTGFGTDGANSADVSLMKKNIPDNMKVKAAGGIRSYEKTIELINAGASRIGASAGIEILKGIAK